MGSTTRRLTLALGCAALLSGCGDVELILGEVPGIMRIVAGVPPTGVPPNARPAEQTELLQPRAVVIDADYNAYIAETRGRLLLVTSAGGIEVLLDPPACGGVPCPERIEAMTYDERGALIIADDRVHRIFRYDLVTRELSVIAGDGVDQSTDDGELAVQSSVALPRGVAVLGDGTVLFSEPVRSVVRSIGTDGRLGTFVGTGIRDFTGDGGPAREARLNGPQCLERRANLLFVCDIGNHRVRVVNLTTGIINTIAGSGVQGYQGDGGPATSARFGILRGLAVSNDLTSLYLADTQNRRVRVVHLPSGVISTYAGDGSAEYRGSGLSPGDTPLQAPMHVALTDLNLLYVVDRDFNLVWRVSLGL